MSCCTVGELAIWVCAFDSAIRFVEDLLRLLDERLDGLDQLVLVALILLLCEEVLDVLYAQLDYA